MNKKIFGWILFFVSLSLFQGAILSFTNSDYSLKKALITGSFLLILSIISLFSGLIFFKEMKKKLFIQSAKLKNKLIFILFPIMFGYMYFLISGSIKISDDALLVLTMLVTFFVVTIPIISFTPLNSDNKEI